jgi:hypothetical protein
MLMKRSKVELNAEVLVIDTYHVKSEQKVEFQLKINRNRDVIGAWYIAKEIPLRLAVMPTNPMEVKMIEEGQAKAAAQLKLPIPDIWISFSTPESNDLSKEFGSAVNGWVLKIESGKYKKFLSG